MLRVWGSRQGSGGEGRRTLPPFHEPTCGCRVAVLEANASF